MKKNKVYLTMREKKALALSGKEVPVCIRGSKSKNYFIAKLRGTIFDGSLLRKKINL